MRKAKRLETITLKRVFCREVYAATVSRLSRTMKSLGSAPASRESFAGSITFKVWLLISITLSFASFPNMRQTCSWGAVRLSKLHLIVPCAELATSKNSTTGSCCGLFPAFLCAREYIKFIFILLYVYLSGIGIIFIINLQHHPSQPDVKQQHNHYYSNSRNWSCSRARYHVNERLSPSQMNTFGL